MKSLKSLVLALLVAAGLSLVVYAASPLEVTVSTVIPNGSVNGSQAFTAAGYPAVTGTKAIRKIVISNNGTVENVQVWKNCASSTTATSFMTLIAKSSDNVVVDLLPNSGAVTSPCISKGTLATGGTVKATLIYE